MAGRDPAGVLASPRRTQVPPGPPKPTVPLLRTCEPTNRVLPNPGPHGPGDFLPALRASADCRPPSRIDCYVVCLGRAESGCRFQSQGFEQPGPPAHPLRFFTAPTNGIGLSNLVKIIATTTQIAQEQTHA